MLKNNSYGGENPIRNGYYEILQSNILDLFLIFGAKILLFRIIPNKNEGKINSQRQKIKSLLLNGFQIFRTAPITISHLVLKY